MAEKYKVDELNLAIFYVKLRFGDFNFYWNIMQSTEKHA